MSTKLTVKEAAGVLSVSEQRIRGLCRSGALACERVGSNWLILKSSIARYGLASGKHLIGDHATHRKPSSKPIALSFFSGAMGLDQGIEKAGFEIRLACEVDKYCRQTIELNRPDIA